MLLTRLGKLSMSTKTQGVLGVGATVALGVVDEWLPDGGTTLLVVVAALALASAVKGQRLPLVFRVFSTGATFYLGYVTCLVGRTMEPGFTAYTIRMALFVFGLYATLPAVALLRIWPGRVRVVLIASVFPVSLAAAALVASFEEYQFIQRHQRGVGPTARWTVSHHWLAYDAETQRLYGSD
jgi:hypothetical protein